MRIIVVGGGVIGVTTAYYLARDGHEVTVVEKEDALGTDATGGNAGLVGRSPRQANLYYNTGHGNLGWTLACGSGRLLSDIMAGRDSTVDHTPFALRGSKC